MMKQKGRFHIFEKNIPLHSVKKLFFFLCLLQFSLHAGAQNLLWSQIASPYYMQVNGVAYSMDGTKVLSGTNCHPASIRLYDAANGTITWDYTVDSSLQCMMGVGFSADGHYLATAEESGHLMIFDYSQPTPDSITTINLGTTYAFALAFAPNSQKLAVGASNGKLQTYQLSTGAIDLNITAHPGWVTAVAYSPDGSRIVTGGNDDKIKVWDTLGNVLDTLTGHIGDISSVQYSPDGTKIVSSATDNTIRIWDAASGTLLHTITASVNDVHAVAVSPNGNYIASAASDTTLKVWSMSNYSLLSTYAMANSGFYYCVAWSPDGTKLSGGTDAGLVITYDASTVGISEKTETGMVPAFPNPCNGILNIPLPHNTAGVFCIVDCEGRTVHSENFNGAYSLLQTDISALAEGVYFFEVVYPEGEKFSGRIVR